MSSPGQVSTEWKKELIDALNDPSQEGSKKFAALLKALNKPPQELYDFLRSQEQAESNDWKFKEHRLTKFVRRIVQDDLVELAKEERYFPLLQHLFQKEKPTLNLFGVVRSAAMVEILRNAGAMINPKKQGLEYDSALTQLLAESLDLPYLSIIHAMLNCGVNVNYVSCEGTALTWAQKKHKSSVLENGVITQRDNPAWEPVIKFLVANKAKHHLEIFQEEEKRQGRKINNPKDLEPKEEDDFMAMLKSFGKLGQMQESLERSKNTDYAFHIPSRVYGDINKLAEYGHPFVCILVPRVNGEKASVNSLLAFAETADDKQKRGALFLAHGMTDISMEMRSMRGFTHDQYDLHVFPWKPTDPAELIQDDIGGFYKKLSILALTAPSRDKYVDHPKFEGLFTYGILKPKSLPEVAPQEVKTAVQNKMPAIEQKRTATDVLSVLAEMDVVCGTTGYMAAIDYATSINSPDLFREIVARGGKFEGQNVQVLLHKLAAKGGDSDLAFLDLLVKECKVDIDVRDESRKFMDIVPMGCNTALYYAVTSKDKNKKAIRHLVQLAADPWAVNIAGELPFQKAVQEADLEVIEILMSSLKKPTAKDFETKVPLASPKKLESTETFPPYKDIYQIFVARWFKEKTQQDRDRLLTACQDLFPGLREALPTAEKYSALKNEVRDDKQSGEHKLDRSGEEDAPGFTQTVKFGHLPLIQYLIEHSIDFARGKVLSDIASINPSPLIQGLEIALSNGRSDIVALLMQKMTELLNKNESEYEKQRFLSQCYNVRRLAIKTGNKELTLQFFVLCASANFSNSVCTPSYEDGKSLLHYLIENAPTLDFMQFFMAEVSKDPKMVTYFKEKDPLIVASTKLCNPCDLMLVRMKKEIANCSDIKNIYRVLFELISLFENYIPELAKVKVELEKLQQQEKTQVNDVIKMLQTLLGKPEPKYSYIPGLPYPVVPPEVFFEYADKQGISDMRLILEATETDNGLMLVLNSDTFRQYGSVCKALIDDNLIPDPQISPPQFVSGMSSSQPGTAPKTDPENKSVSTDVKDSAPAQPSSQNGVPLAPGSAAIAGSTLSGAINPGASNSSAQQSTQVAASNASHNAPQTPQELPKLPESRPG